MSEDFSENEIAELLEILRTEESIPSRVVHRIISGENLIKVWREYREIAQDE